MANLNTAFGLRPVGINGAGPNSNGLTEYRIATDNTDKIWQGTLVVPAATGYVVRGSATGDSQSPIGVFMGCQYVDAVSKKPVWSNYWPGVAVASGTVIKAYVADNPMQTFVVAADGSFASAAALQSAVFANCPLASGASGNDTTGMSSGVADISELATTATDALRIIGIVEDLSNYDISAAGIGLLVRLNSHFNAPVGTTTGVN